MVKKNKGAAISTQEPHIKTLIQMRESERENRVGAVRGQQWTLVSPRRRRGKESAGNVSGSVRHHSRHPKAWGQNSKTRQQGNLEGAGVVSYYFTNFPPSLDIEALCGLFMKWGKVVDVFVPRKRNKEGKAFGFVRFKDVLYPSELERRLDQIWVGTYKLRTNFARFSRHKDDTADGKQRNAPVVGQVQQGKVQQSQIGASYVEVAKGNVGTKQWRKKINVDPNIWRGMDFVAKEEDIAWLSKCYVGCVQNPNAMYLLQDRIIEEGVSNFTISPMGGDMVLIKPSEGEVFEEFIKEYEDLVETWFYDVRKWSPGEVSRQRETWVRCQGVPLQGWSEQFFELLVGSLGTYISVDWSTMQKKQYDIARVLIRTSSWEAINRLVKVRINGVVFTIRLLEKPFPDHGFGMGRVQGGHKNGSSSSSSSSDHMGFSDFSERSSEGDPIDARLEEEIQTLLEGQGVRSGNVERKATDVHEENEELHGVQGSPIIEGGSENSSIIEGPTNIDVVVPNNFKSVEWKKYD